LLVDCGGATTTKTDGGPKGDVALLKKGGIFVVGGNKNSKQK
jgi:hypothetical protein